MMMETFILVAVFSNFSQKNFSFLRCFIFKCVYEDFLILMFFLRKR